jgi:hypothetical protein
MISQLKPIVVRALLISALVCFWNPRLFCQPPATQSRPASSSVLGLWTGESICVGNRPACKNEVVVYRFEAVPGKVGIVLLLADKIIGGQRVPMGKLEFQYNKAKGELSCEFTRGQTHGLWQYKVSGDTMEGTVVLLPGRELGRRVKVKRVSKEEVPAEPAREMYEGP